MKKCFNYVLLFVLSFFVFSSGVLAAELDYNDTTCNYTSKAYINKLAFNVTASYDINTVENEDGTESYSFNINIYNITNDIYINIKDESNPKDAGTIVLPSETSNGTFSFTTDNIKSIVKYKFEVRTNKFGCTSTIRSFVLVKPKWNHISNTVICRYPEMSDYHYCQKWITQEFSLSDEVIYDKIFEHYDSLNTTTTKCITCEVEENMDTRIQESNKIKMYILIGLVIGCVLDIAFIIYTIIRLKRDFIYV